MTLEIHEELSESQFGRMEQILKPSENRIKSSASAIKFSAISQLEGFLQQYIYWIWGESHLIRILEERLTSGRGPWVPPQDPLLARRLREITLEEESGEIDAGIFLSRFELYLSVLDEIKAETTPIDLFLHRLVLTGNIEVALKDLFIPPPTVQLITWFQHSGKGSTLEIASRLFGLRRHIWLADAEHLAVKFSAENHVRLSSLEALILRESQLRSSWQKFAPQLLERLCDTNEDWQQAQEASLDALRQVQNWISNVAVLIPQFAP